MARSARPRDSQRSKVWRAESTLRGDQLTVPELTAFASKIVKSAWFNKKIGRWKSADAWAPQVTYARVTNSRTTCTRGLSGGTALVTCVLGHPHLTQIDLIHSLAHAIVENSVTYEHAWHGPEFCKAMLDLTARWVSPEAKVELQQAFRDHKIKHKVYTPEAREAARQRGLNRWAEKDLLALREELASPE